MIKRRPLAPSFAQLPAAPPRIVFIDSPEAARLACARLREHRLLAVDMEGAPLGQLTTLIQFAPAGGGSDAVYVFDVLALGQTLFDAAHLLPILSDPNVLKLCYDCRGDAAALFFQHGVQVHGLYDLQIVYTSLFQPTQDPFLKGLHRAIERLLSPMAARAFADRKRLVRQKWATCADSVLERPLAPETLAYVAADVAHLCEMYRMWSPFVGDRAVQLATADRVQRHLRRRRQQVATIMSRLDFAPVRPRQLCFVCVAPPAKPV